MANGEFLFGLKLEEAVEFTPVPIALRQQYNIEDIAGEGEAGLDKLGEWHCRAPLC